MPAILKAELWVADELRLNAIARYCMRDLFLLMWIWICSLPQLDPIASLVL
ncbi:hypothetical protein THOA03_750012 [Vibrio owensii]|nr:hypothetical protein THOA03_750012 [Vibrio owensii]